jgi:hypothetical protein
VGGGGGKAFFKVGGGGGEVFFKVGAGGGKPFFKLHYTKCAAFDWIFLALRVHDFIYYFSLYLMFSSLTLNYLKITTVIEVQK